jgi:HK97 family phage prohead protease
MPRRGSAFIQPIRLGGRSVQPLRDHQHASDAERSEFDWTGFARAVGLDRDSQSYLEFKRVGMETDEIAAKLQLGVELEAIQKRIRRAVVKARAERAPFERPVQGSSRSLSYRESLSGGLQVWTLAKLSPTFLQVLADERESYNRRTDFCPETAFLSGRVTGANMQERRSLSFDLKSLDTDGVFSGILAAYGNEDQQGDVIQRGAFADSLRQSSVYPLLLDHDPTKQAGALYLRDTERGLEVSKGVLNLDTQEGQKAYSNLRFNQSHKIRHGMSIGYRTQQSRPQGKVRILEKVRLFEGSTTLFPANEQAYVSSVKTTDLTPEEFRAWVRESSARFKRDLDRISKW